MPTRPSDWGVPVFEARGPGGRLAYLAGAGGGPRVQVWAGGRMTADFLAFDSWDRGGVNGAWGDDGRLYLMPGGLAGPRLRVFTQYGEQVSDSFAADPAARAAWVPVPVAVPVDRPVKVVEPLPTMTWGDPTRPDVLRVFVDWQSRKFPRPEDADACVREAMSLLYGDRYFAFLAGPLPAGAPAGYCWATVGLDLTWVNGTPAGLTPDDLRTQVYGWHLRRGCWLDDRYSLTPAALGKLLAHELKHAVFMPGDHRGEYDPGLEDRIRAGVSAACAAARGWRG